jgi:hypothetical protein
LLRLFRGEAIYFIKDLKNSYQRELKGTVVCICKNKNKKRSRFGNIFYFCSVLMRIIAVKTLKQYWEDYPEAEGALLSWYIVFVIWFGTHKEYDRIDAKTVRYAKTDKK